MVKYHNFEAELKRAGISKEEFAKRIGTSTQTLWNKATGKINWDLRTMVKCCDTLRELTHQDLNIKYLFEDDYKKQTDISDIRQHI